MNADDMNMTLYDTKELLDAHPSRDEYMALKQSRCHASAQEALDNT